MADLKRNPVNKKRLGEKLAVMLGQQEAPSIDLKELVREINIAWGGSSALARDLREEWLEAPKGGMARQRILEIILRSITYVTTHEMDKLPEVEELSKEDLQNYMRNSAARLLASEDEEEEPAEVPDGEANEFDIFDSISEVDGGENGGQT